MPQSIIHIGGATICSDTAQMEIPAGGSHVRQVEFRLPLFEHRPIVTTTIYTNQGPGNPFAVYSVTINTLGPQTQVVISATNVAAGVPVPYDYFCDIIVIGKATK